MSDNSEPDTDLPELPEMSSPPRVRLAQQNHGADQTEDDDDHVLLRQPAATSSSLSVPRPSHHRTSVLSEQSPAGSAVSMRDENPFRRRSHERHSVHGGDFAMRRSPKDSPGGSNWKDMFTSKRLKRKIQKHLHVGDTTSEDDRLSNESSSSSAYDVCELACLSSAELKDIVRRSLMDRNVPQAGIDQILLKSDKELREMIALNKKAGDSNKKSPRQLVSKIAGLLQSEPVPSHLKDLETMRVSLAGADVQFVLEFATTILPDQEPKENGLQLLEHFVRKVLKSVGDRLDCVTELLVVTELLRCIKCILNISPGIALVLRDNSTTLQCLLEVLSYLNGRPQTAESMALRRDVVTVIAPLAFAEQSQFPDDVHLENTGASKIMRELTSLSIKLKQPRFKPILGCLEFCTTPAEHVCLHRLLVIVNVLINRSDDSLGEEQAWQLRMRIRSEMVRDGMGRFTKRIEAVSQKVEGVAKAYKTYIDHKEEDFAELVSRFESLRGEYDSLDGCFELLASTSTGTAVEPLALSILQHLMLIPEDITVRLAYFRLIESCISEIVLHKNGVDPDFDSQFRFETSISDMIEQLQDSEISRKLEQTVQAKQEAVARQMQYWQKLDEFRKETELLRKHIANPSTPLPPVTVCTLQQPCTSSGSTGSAPSGLPPITGGPPPPPPPGGLPPITGGPPPPPPPNGLPPVTGGPPPPPPPGSGGPPPPPPPPPGLCGGPPGPPPPPPGLLGKGGPGGPPPPPPPGGFGGPLIPALPEYLTIKKKRVVDVPMRKFPWGSGSLNPRELTADCFWAQAKEEKLAKEELLNRLKERFASARPHAAGKTDGGGGGGFGGKQLKKVKQPQIVQDEKVMKALEILHGSVKIPHNEWKRIILEIDETALTSTTLQQLRAALPPMDMLKKLSEADKNTLNEMPEGELFVAALSQISALPLRLDLIIFKMRFAEILNELKPGISAVSEACEELRRSKGFRSFLELALLYGNYMGQSSKTHKDIFGFEMSVLPKICDTKDVENHQTLLHYMIESLRELDPKHVRFTQDFYHCTPASRVNSDELQRGVAALKQNVTKLETALKSYKCQSGKDRFEEVMGPFLATAQQELATVETLHNNMKSAWTGITKYYAFDAKKYKMEGFFADMKTFRDQYESACRDIDQERLRAEKEKEKRSKASKEKRAPLTAMRDATNGPLTGAAAMNKRIRSDAKQSGVLDELEQMMNTANLDQFLLAARTPKAKAQIPGRTRKGQQALHRQRSRGGDLYMMTPSDVVASNKESERTGGIGHRVLRQKGTSAAAAATAAGGGAPISPAGPHPEMIRQLKQRTSPSHKENVESRSGGGGEVMSTDDLLARMNQL